MIRHCDGKDENLIMYVDPETGVRCGGTVDEPESTTAVQRLCNCGMIFDDMRRSTVYPHRLV